MPFGLDAIRERTTHTDMQFDALVLFAAAAPVIKPAELLDAEEAFLIEAMIGAAALQ